jgi:hypothetical protein
VAGWSLELRGETNAAEHAIFIIHEEFQVETGVVVVATAEARVL